MPDEQTYDAVEVVELDEALDEVVQVYEERISESDQAWDSIAHSVEDLGSAISTLSGDVTGLSGDVRALSDSSPSSDDSTVYSVALTDAQWAEMQQAWSWAKSCGSVVLFLCLVSTLISCAILGSHLWTHFSRGWRN